MCGGGELERDRDDVWRLRNEVGDVFAQIAGYAVEAADGFVGTVAMSRSDQRGAFLIVLGGSWNGGRTLMLPAAAIRRVEEATRLVHLQCTRAQLAAAPAFENDRYQDAAYRAELAEHYGGLLGRQSGIASVVGATALGSRPGPFVLRRAS